ncbi:MAG: alpha/beta hydrolase [Gammaproteobacteria bacterium]|nr:alpha/beta hydrolase [Gammaproteobacteria bacterium]
MSTMFVVSCRKNFWSATEFSPTDEIRELDLDSGNGPVIAPAAFLQAMAQKRITVVVHGYNNERLDVVASYRTIDAQMRLLGFLGAASRPYDALVGFAWPGGATGVSFPFARGRADDTAPRFGRLLADLRGRGATVDLNTHSLGAHVAFEALRDASSQVVRNAWNFASAVDNESVEQGERYFDASRRSARFYVFHSKNDPVLRVWYRVGDFFDFDTALRYSGPEDPRAIIDHSRHVTVVNCKDVVTSHGGYRSSGQVWSFMAQELTSPTNERFVTLKKTPEALTAVFRATGGSFRAATTATARRRSPAGKRKRASPRRGSEKER